MNQDKIDWMFIVIGMASIAVLVVLLAGCSSFEYANCNVPTIRHEKKAFPVALKMHSECVKKKAYQVKAQTKPMTGVFTPCNMTKKYSQLTTDEMLDRAGCAAADYANGPGGTTIRGDVYTIRLP